MTPSSLALNTTGPSESSYPGDCARNFNAGRFFRFTTQACTARFIQQASTRSRSVVGAAGGDPTRWPGSPPEVVAVLAGPDFCERNVTRV